MRLKLSQPSLAGVGAGSELGNYHFNNRILLINELIPTRNQMSKTVFLTLIKSLFRNVKCDINHRLASRSLFKNYVSKLGGKGLSMC